MNSKTPQDLVKKKEFCQRNVIKDIRPNLNQHALHYDIATVCDFLLLYHEYDGHSYTLC